MIVDWSQVIFEIRTGVVSAAGNVSWRCRRVSPSSSVPASRVCRREKCSHKTKRQKLNDCVDGSLLERIEA